VIGVSSLSETAVTFCVFSILLIPLAGAGLLLVNVGLGRSRSAAHSMLCSLCAVTIAAVVYFICGFSWQSFVGRPAHSFTLAGKTWSWLGAEPFFWRGLELNAAPASLAACLQIFSVGLASLIPISAGSDRWRLGAVCWSTALLAGCTYPVFAHWVWGGGWLAQLGSNYGLGMGFLDIGGASSIQAVGGLTALAISWILGPRQEKYSSEGVPVAMPGHNVILAGIGCLLALVGWLGLNSAGAIVFAGIEPARFVLIAVNTLLAAAGATLMAVMITSLRYGKPDASLSINGWISGLVAGSASCALVQPWAALLIGVVAGAAVIFAIEILELRLAIDDPAGAISVHGIAGVWGVMAVGLFIGFPHPLANAVSGTMQRLSGESPNSGQWLAQLLGVATLLGFVFPLTYSLNWLLNRFYRQRVSAEGERQGMDLHELGAGAYPEFVTHGQDFFQR
jgi:Amt family ammonium transporter